MFDDVNPKRSFGNRPTARILNTQGLQTPAFVYDQSAMAAAASRIAEEVHAAGAKVVFSVKAFAYLEGLRSFLPLLDGASVSSLFEARLARSVVGFESGGGVHVTTPGFRHDEIFELAESADYVSFNSLGQFERLRPRTRVRASFGLRVNPEVSFVTDERYDPCRPGSKLGVPLDVLSGYFASADPEDLAAVEGLHFHTNCESMNFDYILKTVRSLDDRIPKVLEHISWINLGGGYQYDAIDDFRPFREAVSLLRSKYGLEVFVEPGEAIVGRAGYIASSVIDLFTSGGKEIAILDTSVNHMPQVFEYQYVPQLENADPLGNYKYVLGGASCLAGDMFGEYSFKEPLALGSRVVFGFMGAYSAVKSHMFNGLNLPSVYSLDAAGRLDLKRRYTYDDYLSKWT